MATRRKHPWGNRRASAAQLLETLVPVLPLPPKVHSQFSAGRRFEVGEKAKPSTMRRMRQDIPYCAGRVVHHGALFRVEHRRKLADTKTVRVESFRSEVRRLLVGE
jgi:hypothetical protein